jgi:acyl transferase domain-containing protein/7-keto-8-aminopelargonate synthetase-like enzyme/acyl carrier protein/SAM-dependent methyltransferase
LPFYDPVTHKTHLPYHFDEDYLHFLLDGLSIATADLLHFVEKAKLLKESQFTFKKYLEEWDILLRQHAAKSLDSMFDSLIHSEEEKDNQEKVLLILIIKSSLRQLDQKWELTRKPRITDKKVQELLDLIIDGVMPKEMVIELFMDGEIPDLNGIATRLNKRQDHLNTSKPYQFLNQHRQKFGVIADLSAWIQKAMTSDLGVPVQKPLSYLEFGQSNQATTPDDLIHIAITGKNTLKETLLQLWLKGVNIKWDMLYPEGSFNKVSLPTYCFERASFWLTKVNSTPQDNNQSEKLEQKYTQLNECFFKTTDKTMTERIVKQIESEVLQQKLNQDLELGMLEVEQYGHLLLLKAFQSMQLMQQEGEKYFKSQLKRQIGIIEKYDRLFEALLDILERSSVIHRRDNEEIIVTEQVKEPQLQRRLSDLDAEKTRLTQNFPDKQAHLNLLEAALSSLKEILTGKIKGTDVLFPNSSMALIEGFYQKNRFADYYNQLVAKYIQYEIESQLRQDGRQSQKVKILELGAGTGGTSAQVLEQIASYEAQVEYCYTDISMAFVKYGKKQFHSQYPFMRFSTLNIEGVSEEKRAELGDFNIIFATNVVHATKNLVDSVGEIKRFLKPQGCLILSELTYVQDFLALAFGSLDGWWLFEDSQLRLPHSPLLSPEAWKTFFVRMGFEKVSVFGNPSQDLKDQKQCLVVGYKNQESLLANDAQVHKQSNIYSESEKEGGQDRLIISKVTALVAKTLEVPTNEIGLDDRFSELGVDSILGVELVNTINKELNEQLLNATTIFDYPSVKELSKYILKQLSYVDGFAKPDDNNDNRLATAAQIISVTHENEELLKNVPETVSVQADHHIPKQPAVMKDDDIAIIGMSGQFPGANNLDEFWENIALGKNSISEIPKSRWDIKKHFDSTKPAETGYQKGGFLTEIDKFDPLFFNISPKEAELMDPQQRLFLECSWKALEDAGYSQLSEQKVGIYVGIRHSDYFSRILENQQALDIHVFTGNDSSILAARLAYYLDLKGPSLAVDTACSSSLVAIHLAAHQIRTNQIDIAIAGGVVVMTTPQLYMLALNSDMLSPEGQCKTFDNDANGFVPAEGVGVVVLKSLEKAIKDGDHIYGVIKGSGINQDGKTNGITAPSTLSQTRLELEVYKQAKINPETISYVEAHGTGTKLGDPIEVEALTNAYRQYTQNKQFCAIGSVKTNIGHTQYAAGVAGVIKVLLALKHKKIPPSINFKKPNEHINFKESPFYVPTQLQDWKTENGGKRRATVSAFGFSGTNAHLVIEEYISPLQKGLSVQSAQLIVLSAKNPARLKASAKQIVDFLTPAKEVESVDFVDNDSLSKDKICQYLLDSVSQILKVSDKDISLDEALSDYGFDTVSLTALNHRIHDKYQLEITPAIFSEYASIGALAQYLCEIFQKTTQVDLADRTLSGSNQQLSLADVAYTLQVGRFAMEERLALVVSSLDDLRNKLTQYYQGQTEIEDFYCGNIKANNAATSLLIEGKSGQIFLRAVTEEKEFSKLAQLWVLGVDIDWQLLYLNQKPQRISLPTYPFAEERYWIPVSKSTFKVASELSEIARLHPLLESNTSSFLEQKFTTRLTGEEFYLTDHVVDSQKTLPGVAYLEMARAACELAGEQSVMKLSNIVWAKPITVSDTPIPVHISLYPSQQQVEFEVSTLDDNQQRQLQAQGKLIYGTQTVRNYETIDIKAIQNRCFETWDRAKCYNQFQVSGFNYGPDFQSIQTLHCNDSEALSRLQLPNALTEKFHEFVLHPSIMDGALQTVIGLSQITSNVPYLPFALESIELFKPLSEMSYAYAKQTSASDSAVKKFDLSIVDDTGQVQVRFSDLSLRALKSQTETPVKMYYQSVWKPEVLEEQMGTRTSTTVLLFDIDSSRYWTFKERFSNQVILVMPGERFQALEPQTYSINPNHLADYRQLLGVLSNQNGLPSHIIHLWSQAQFVSELATLNTQLNSGFWSIFHLSQALLEQKPVDPIQLLYIYLEENDALQPQYAALGGFAKTIHLENSKFFYKTVALPTLEKVGDIVLAELQASNGIEIRYDNTGQRWVKRLQEVDESPEAENTVLLKKHGVYLITGGAGGLGLIFAEYLAKKLAAKLVLTGRSELNPATMKQIQSLSSLGAEVIYHKADVSKRDEVEKLIAQTKSHFGHLNGIIHAAGVIQDAWILKKTQDDIAAVLAPKVFGTLNLDEVTQTEPLDFFVLFSSTSAIMGNVGQCDYAYANGFMDGFAAWRSALEKRQQRFGKTVTINWPLWRNGGMRVDEQTEKWLANTWGMQPMSTETGISAFCQGLKREETNQLMVLEGHRAKVKKGLGIETAISKATTVASIQSKVSAQTETDQLLEKLQTDLLTIISAILKIGIQDIDLSDDISEYGFDSISFTEFANKINDKYQLSITPAIFFEYPSVDAFSRFLCNEYQEHFLDYYHIDSTKVESTPSLVTKATDIDIEKTDIIKETIALQEKVKPKNRFVKPMTTQTVQDELVPPANTPIAIIGQSGIMPQSEDLECFWQHLEAGDNLITEVPIERWNWQEALDAHELSVHANKIKWGGFMPAVDKFDPLFFGISPREANLMDPQQRLFLETVWKTIEDAGYKASDLSGTQTGLFVGVATHDYSELLKDNGLDIEAYAPTCTALSIVANRVSYFLNLHGPSEPINTACSSALVAIHRAVEAIRRGVCEMAIAGGVNVMSTSTLTIAFSKVDVLSQDGHCRVFDKQANGYVRSEGVGAILLKPLNQAQADGDTIYAVIRGTAENHGGHATSLTAPNPNAQTQLLISAYKNADIDPSTISYIEAHSTGTNLGDPIEINGLKNAFAELYKKYGKSFPKEPHCGIGSVKTNIGHLEAASGMAGIFKVLFAMKHKKLPGLLHFSECNPYIQLHGSPFYLVTENQTWTPLIDHEGQKIPRRAGVSAFGFGGANAHIVLEEYEQNSLPVVDEPTQLMVLSAKNSERLGAIAQQMLNFLSKKPDILLSNLTYTLQVGREAMDERLAMVVENIEEVKDKLTQYVQGQTEIKLCYRGNVKSNRAQSQLLIEGEEGRDFVESLIKNRKLTKLAQLWVLGVEIDWQLIYPSNKPQRIPLPTYPFARDRYWVPQSKQPSQSHRKSLDCIERERQLATSDLVAPSATNKHLAQTTLNEYYATILTRVRDLFTTVTGFNQIGNEESLIESGIDSISGVEFRERLEKTYGMTLSTTFLRDYPTLHKITGYFVQQQATGTDIDLALAAEKETQQQLTTQTDTEVKLVTEDGMADNFKEMADFTYRFASELKGRRAKIDGQWYIDYGSCNYLGFDWHPYIMDAVRPALAQWGVHPPWSRTVASPQIYQELEIKLAELVEAPYVDVFPTVTLLNMGLMPELIGPEDTLFIDQYAHNCLQRAAALCHERGSRIVVFRHNDVAYLERKMKEVSLSSKKLVVVDGIYSLDGTHAPLPELVELGKRYNAWIMVDDSHGFGVIGEQPSSEFPYGKRGNGIAKYYDLDYGRDGIIYVGQLSKAYSTMGGFVAYGDPMIKTAVQNAFSMVFSGPLPTASLATGIAGIEINEREGDKARAMILDRTRLLIHGLHELGYTIDSLPDSHLIRVTLGAQPTSVEFLRKLMVDERIIVTPAVYPAVEWTNTGLRFMVTALHTEEDITETLASMKKLAYLANLNVV